MDSHVTWTKDPETGAQMPVFDRAVTSEPLREYIKGVITNGVLPNPSTNLQVSAGTNGMTVVVQAGFCVIEGGLAIEPNTRTLEVTAADSTYDRIDTVVARWDANDASRKVDLHIRAGVPASSPIRPTLTREGSIYELGLADVFVTKNVATITNEKITDTRYESARCGICSSIAEWDTTTIYQQVQSDLAGFKTNEQAEFLAWFNRMKDQLSKDAAGHLQSEIDVVNVAISGLSSTKQNKEDNTLDTTAKTIVGAINEHEADITRINSDLSKLNQSLTILNGSVLTYRPVTLNLSKNEVYTTDSYGNFILPNSINENFVISIRVLGGNYMNKLGYNPSLGYYCHVENVDGNPVTNTTVTVDVLYIPNAFN